MLGCGGNAGAPGLDNATVTMEGKPQPPPGPSLPDGYTIAFHKADKRGHDQIFTMTGSQTTQVTTGTNTCRRPTWSPPGYPGGPFILYSEGTGLYRIKPDGTGRTQITHPSPTQSDETADWSPLGGKVVFRRSDAYDQMWPTVMTHDLTTGAEVALAPMDPSPWNWDQTSPSFSPDGLKVAFQAVTWDPVVEYKHGPVFTVNSTGGTATAIPGTEGMPYGQPDWGPTGANGHSKVVLRDQLALAHGLVVIGMDGNNQPVGLPSPIISGVDIVAPHWSWDGVYIAADSCYLKADGTGLTTGVGGSGNTWKP
jgi:Tol biopolymer transport system component